MQSHKYRSQVGKWWWYATLICITMSVLEEVKAAEAAAEKTLEDAKSQASQMVTEAQVAQKNALEATKLELQTTEAAGLEAHAAVIKDKQQKIEATSTEVVKSFTAKANSAMDTQKENLKQAFLASK